MNALVLGGFGFIGGSLITELLCIGQKIKVFDKNQPSQNMIPFNLEDTEVVIGIFSKDYDFEKLTRNIDIVYHFISTTTPASKVSTIQELDENVASTIALLDACVKNKVKQVLFLSSGGTVYGNAANAPLKETDQTNPKSSYGIQKLMIEKYLNMYYEYFGLDYRVVRLSNPYGPLQNPHGGQGVVTAFTYSAIHNIPIKVFGDGAVIRDYIYIDDVVQGILKISQYNGKEKIFNLGSGKGYSLMDVINTIETVQKKKLNIIYEPQRIVDVPYNVLDINRFTNLISKNSAISFTQGIKKLSDFYIAKLLCQ